MTRWLLRQAGPIALLCTVLILGAYTAGAANPIVSQPGPVPADNGQPGPGPLPSDCWQGEAPADVFVPTRALYVRNNAYVYKGERAVTRELTRYENTGSTSEALVAFCR